MQFVIRRMQRKRDQLRAELSRLDTALSVMLEYNGHRTTHVGTPPTRGDSRMEKLVTYFQRADEPQALAKVAKDLGTTAQNLRSQLIRHPETFKKVKVKGTTRNVKWDLV